MKPPIKYGPHAQYIEVWGAASESNPKKTYTVARTSNGTWSCSCPVWIYNSARPECKHIRFVKQFSVSQPVDINQIVYQPLPETVSKALSQFSMLDIS
jgi:hypothetical protein